MKKDFKIDLAMQCDDNEVLMFRRKSFFDSIIGFTQNEFLIGKYVS